MTAQIRTFQTPSLFAKYGGLGALRAVIFDFYDRVLESDVVGHFFEDVDLAKLVDHQTKFFASVLGGPANIADQRLAYAHAHLHVTHAHFDEIAGILHATLTDAGFTPEDLKLTLAAVEARRSIIVK
ncbi:group I truncated hemoglobin [Ruegeria arenilitoris]|uniref:group I truncated hemoglobin n=1 Tax=Ruegeria arenilitoris TaxID=1173585 RepID=UPI001479B86E|nr:group 1 truncated hemoglobin [Ruegeria arenilitoris]